MLKGRQTNTPLQHYIGPFSNQVHVAKGWARLERTPERPLQWGELGHRTLQPAQQDQMGQHCVHHKTILRLNRADWVTVLNFQSWQIRRQRGMNGGREDPEDRDNLDGS